MTKNRVSLSEDTLNQLSKVGKPFETVDDCLQRILDAECTKIPSEQQDDVVEEEDS